MSRSHSKIALALLLVLAITPLIFSARPNPKSKTKQRKTRKADEETQNVYDVKVKSMEIYYGDDYETATAVNDGYPKLRITVNYPDLDGELFQDNPTLKLHLVESRINKTKDSEDTYSVKTDIDFEDLTETVTLTCSSITQEQEIDYAICETTEQLTGYFTLFEITTDNGAYNYVYDNVNIIDKAGNLVPQYMYWGEYVPNESNTEKIQDLIYNETDDNARYVIVSLSKKYSGDLYFFVKLESQDTLKRINCKSYGTKEIKCSGGGIPYGETGVLYYLYGSDSNFRLLNVTVKNEFYVLVKTNEFPEDDDTCSSIYKGYQFTIEFEGFTTGKVFDREISVNLQTVNDDETINYLPCLCWPTTASASNRKLTCETTKSGKGGKTYTLDPIIGFDCQLFNNGSFCLNIDNAVLNISTKIKAGYAGLDQARNNDLTYNKAQLSSSDYPRNITLYFRDIISSITEIVAGKVDITKGCFIQEDKMSLKCMINESDLVGNEQSATTYVSYEINFYDVCGNFRRGPTIKVAGTTDTSNDSNEDEEEKEHDYRNNSKGSSFLDVSRIIEAISLLVLAF